MANGKAKTPCLDTAGRFFLAPDVVSNEITQGNMPFAANMPCCPYLVFTENSTKTKFIAKSSLLGEWSASGKLTGIAGDIYNSQNQKYVFERQQTTNVYKYPNSLIADYREQDCYIKTLYILHLRKVSSGDTWTTDRIVVLRADVNPDIFNFNSELLKSRLNQEQEGDEDDDAS